MSKQVEGIQPSVLRWARETAGLTHVQVAERLKRSPSDIVRWEEGDSAPTYPQLERLAYEMYKRPLAIFFFPAPPEEKGETVDFRTLPSEELESLSSDTRYQVRLAKALQLSLVELHDGRNPIPDSIFRTIRLTVNSDAIRSAREIRDALAFTLKNQQSAKDSDEALKLWRKAVEDAGVYVFKQKRISGFSIQHEQFPVIYLNNSTSKNRQIFSLLHELCHVLMHINGISTVDDLMFGDYAPHQRRIEVFCNRVAAEILLPQATLDSLIRRGKVTSDAWIAKVASRFRISREVVLRRLLDRQVIDESTYINKFRAWANAPRQDKGGGGNYYATNASYLGEKYVRLVLGKHYQGHLSLEQAADYLGIKTGSVSGLESRVLGGLRDS